MTAKKRVSTAEKRESAILRKMTAEVLKDLYKKYVKHSGQICPFCGAEDTEDYVIDGGYVEVDGNYTTQKVTCNVCDSCWVDVYRRCGLDPVRVTEEAAAHLFPAKKKLSPRTSPAKVKKK